MAAIWHPQPINVYRDWINSIMDEASDKLTDWENSFIASIQMKVDKGIQLSQSQAEKLEQIYASHTK